jgi:hypothetical protein
MPTYTFKNINTGEITEKFMKISARDIYLEDNANLEGYITSSPYLVQELGGVLSKTSDGWNDVLRKIKSGSGQGNSIHTKN